MKNPAKKGIKRKLLRAGISSLLISVVVYFLIAAVAEPLLVAAGTADKAFKADQFEPTISQYTDVQVELLSGVTHMGIVVGEEIRPVIKKWLENLS